MEHVSYLVTRWCNLCTDLHCWTLSRFHSTIKIFYWSLCLGSG